MNSLPSTKTLLKVLLSFEIAVIALAVLVGQALDIRVETAFGERSPITWLSVFQLLVVGTLALYMLHLRREDLHLKFWQAPALVWAVIGLGFIALAADEKFLIHENLDLYIHSILNLRETVWTDKIDDVLIGIYALTGVGIVLLNRQELKRYQNTQTLIIIAFAFLFLTIVLDTLTNGFTFIPTSVQPWLKVGEEGFKILSEGMFIGFVYQCLITLTQQRVYRGPS